MKGAFGKLHVLTQKADGVQLLASYMKCAWPQHLMNWHAPEDIYGRGLFYVMVIEFLQGQPSVSGTSAGQHAANHGANGKNLGAF